MADGLPSNAIHDIEEDDRGFIWTGGTNGLSRYDGYRFTPFNGFGENGAERQNIGLLHIFGRQQLLWVSTANYAYGCYDLRRECFVPLYHGGHGVTGFNKRFHGSAGQWLYYGRGGVCYPVAEDGRPVMRTYTAKNGMLPSDQVNSLAEDAAHHLWIATSKGLVRLAGTKPVVVLPGQNIIHCMSMGHSMLAFSQTNQTLYVFHTNGKLLGKQVLPLPLEHINKINSAIAWRGSVVYFTPKCAIAFHTGKRMFYRPTSWSMEEGYLQGQADGYQLVANRMGHVLLFSPKGQVVSLDFSSKLLTTDEKNKVFDMAGNHRGELYIATYGMGLYIYNTLNHVLSHYTAEDDAPLMQSDYLNHVMVDHSGCIWLCTESAGISRLQPVSDFDATYYYIKRPGNGNWANFVRSVYVNKNGLTTLSSKYGSAYTFSARALTPAAPVSRAGVNHYRVDARGNEWISTCGDGLYVNGVRYARESSLHSLPVNDISGTVEDPRHRVWVATWGGGLLMAEWHNGQLTPFKQVQARNYNESHMRSVACGSDGYLYVATLNGLYVVNANRQHIGANDFAIYNAPRGNFPGNEVQCLAFARGRLWAGVMACGVVECHFAKGTRKMTWRAYGQAEGLADNDVRSILPDGNGTLWVGCASGLSCIGRNSVHIQTYALSNHPESNAFVLNSAVRQGNGLLLFGTENGLLAIRPAKSGLYAPASLPVRVTDLLVGGLSVYSHADSTLSASLPLPAGKASLSSKQNVVTFCYSNFNYRHIASQLYQVMLEGYDRHWSRPTTSNTAVYANLKPGRYVFRVKAFDGRRWSRDATFELLIRQPWFNTWWAWLCYVTLALAVGSYMLHLYRERLRISQHAKVEKEVNDMRLNFFTQIAHEFRTPLSIIQYGVQYLDSQWPQGLSSAPMQTISRGCKRLERMMNELMEFRRVSTNNKRLQVAQGDLVVFVRNVFQDFWNAAEQKELTYTFVPFARHATVPFDASVVECVVYNLLSNAVKYVGRQGMVTLRLTRQEGLVCITVEDNGPGISPERQKKLFRPFMHGDVSQGGMGIGLYTASRLAMIHHGTLCYEQASAEGGSRFVFAIPGQAEAYRQGEWLANGGMHVATHEAAAPDAIPLMANAASLNTQTVAIIEDDADMMRQNRDMVGRYFRTVGFVNGKEGLEGICAMHPDLVLCDVKLPDMDGYEVIRRMRENPGTADIPVIILTAFDDEEHQLKAYKAGADEYMVKPCNYKLLLARMVQLIKWKEAHKTQTDPTQSHDIQGTPQGTVVESRADKLFMENVARLTVDNLGSMALNADFLAERMHMGRTKFFGKMKQLLGVTPNKYIMDKRLEVAADLISSGGHTITEVCYKVGFSTPSYFNKCFKQKYGVAPSQYGKQA